jgi:hypothetical protein
MYDFFKQFLQVTYSSLVSKSATKSTSFPQEVLAMMNELPVHSGCKK